MCLEIKQTKIIIAGLTVDVQLPSLTARPPLHVLGERGMPDNKAVAQSQFLKVIRTAPGHTSDRVSNSEKLAIEQSAILLYPYQNPCVLYTPICSTLGYLSNARHLPVSRHRHPKVN